MVTGNEHIQRQRGAGSIISHRVILLLLPAPELTLTATVVEEGPSFSSAAVQPSMRGAIHHHITAPMLLLARFVPP